jgi:ferredoxin
VEHRLVLFDDDCVRIASEGASLYGAFTLGRAVTEADVLISLPKLKTHGFMMFTGAVKNLFGCIPGLDKAQYHLKVPDRDDFGAMLVDLMLACKPALAVMDAVVGMEGDGPAGGTPRHVGALLASADCLALDVVASAIAGLDPKEVYSNKAGLRRGLCPGSADEVEIVGVGWREVAPENVAPPARDVSAMMPPWLGRRMRGWTTARPVLARPADCTKCKRCEENCPVNAIVVGAGGPSFDHTTCIRCYCCQELCPPQAIGLSVPRVARLMTRGRSK